MIAYWGVFIFLILGSVFEQISKSKKYKKFIYIFSLILLTLFLGLRGYIGYDWYSYKPNFENINNLLEGIGGNYSNILYSGYEIGFQIYTSLLKVFTKNYFIYTFINTGIDFFILYFVIKKYSNFPILSLLIFFGVYGLALEIDMLRNAKSIMLFLISINFIEKRKAIYFFLLNLIGIFFHISSILYLPMYFILNIKWNRKFILILFILGNLYYLSNLRLGINFIKNYSLILPSGIGERLNSYFSIIPLDFPLGFTFYYFERVILFIGCWLVSESLMRRKYGNIMLNSMYISIFFFLFLSEFSIISFRFSLLFIYSYWFILPMLMEEYPNMFVIILAVVISAFRLENQLYFEGNKEVYKYQNILVNANSQEEQLKKVERAAKFKVLGHGKEISLLF